MDRRGFLNAILASGIAPYIVTSSGVLMPVRKISIPRAGAIMRADELNAEFSRLQSYLMVDGRILEPSETLGSAISLAQAMRETMRIKQENWLNNY